MGDRGGTATDPVAHAFHPHYTRWEIGGEPQREWYACTSALDYTRWEIGGEPQLDEEDPHA